jgi:predicted dehydrogenase
MSRRTSRRDFLKTTATGAVAAGTLFAAPMIVPARAFGANERIVTGHIGVGNQGGGLLGNFLSRAAAQPAAVAEVDSDRAAKAAKKIEDKGNPCEVFTDYRKLLDRRDIDAVVIATPDHWHALTTIDACDAGKHVYCEKPLSLTIAEGRAMVDAARRNERTVQTGSQQRSASEFRRACEYVRNGRLGEIKEVLVGIPTPNHPGELGPDTAPPSNLDYDLWLGPAPEKPYNEKRVHYNFRFWWDYSGGQMTNFGAHHLDIAQWALGRDDSGPVAIEGQGTFHPQGWHEVTETCRVTYTYDDGVKVVLGQKQSDIPSGCTFVGSEGRLYVNRGKISSDPAAILIEQLSGRDERLYESKNHYQNFLDCIASGEKPICDVEIGHRSATVCHLGNIAIRTGERLEWDPVKEQITNSSEAQAMTTKAYRSPWKLPA